MQCWWESYIFIELSCSITISTKQLAHNLKWVITLAWWSMKRSEFLQVSKSQLMLFVIILDIPTTKRLWKMYYTAQIQDTSDSHFGQFLKSKPWKSWCKLFYIIDFTKIDFSFLNFQSEYVVVCCYPNTFRLHDLSGNKHSLALSCPTSKL